MKRLLLLTLLAAFALPTAPAFGKGTESAREVDDVAMGQILDKAELGSFQGLSGLPGVLCREKAAKAQTAKAAEAVAVGEEASSKRGG